MAKSLNDQLAADQIASRFGCALKPELRAAIQMDLRFPAKAASPLPQHGSLAGELPANVVRLGGKSGPQERKSA